MQTEEQRADFRSRLEVFLFIYFFELEQVLYRSKSDLSEISFHADEANVDEPFKQWVKTQIESKLLRIPASKGSQRLRLQFKKDSGASAIDYSYCSFEDIEVKQVLLPKELDAGIKELLKRERKEEQIFTNPDLTIEFVDKISNESAFVTIELKSTKNNSIPGSSIQQVNPLDWVIFLKHSNNNFDIACGQYVDSITSKLQFPDRSPRPQVAFNTLSSWNASNRVLENEILSYMIDEDERRNKYILLGDWQCFLAEEWLHVIKSPPKSNEPWFHKTIKKFCDLFINYFDNLSQENKDKLKKSLKEYRSEN